MRNATSTAVQIDCVHLTNDQMEDGVACTVCGFDPIADRATFAAARAAVLAAGFEPAGCSEYVWTGEDIFDYRQVLIGDDGGVRELRDGQYVPIGLTDL